MKLKSLLFIFFITIAVFFNSSNVLANNDKLTTIELANLENNQVLGFFNDQFKIKTTNEVLNNITLVTAKKILAPFDWPWNFNILTPVYEFDLANQGQNYNRHLPLEVEINYSENNNKYYKQVFFLDGSSNRWRPLPSFDNPEKGVIKARLHFPFVRLAVFYNPDISIKGEASWYSFKDGLFAASPDFPRGSVIRVHNLENNQFVDVTINDYGPDRSIYPNRIIDLDRVAFNKIASTGDGLIDILLEPLHIPLNENDHVFRPRLNLPEINAKSAIAISEKTGDILFNKEAEQVASLASLTKLVAVKTFLDLGISLDKEVTYLDDDEKFNHEYVRPWESAKLAITGGEVLTVRDIINVAVIRSANNITETLVRASGLKREEFIARMNILTEVWGARNTKFIEPTGLSRDNVSSPLDYAIIMREIFKDPLLAEISNKKNYSFTTVNTNRTFRVINTNQSFLYGPLPYNGTKTGFINASGHCLFSRFNNGEDNIIIVSFGSGSREASYNDHDKLLRYSLRQ